MHLFKDAITLASPDFILLGHTGEDSLKNAGIIGKNSRGQLVHYSGFDILHGTYSKSKTIAVESGTIVNVITQSFYKDETNHLVVTKDSSGVFRSQIYNEDGKIKARLPESLALPMIVSDPSTLETLVMLQEKESIHFYKITEDAVTKESRFSINRKLAPTHTSAFIDLTGNLVPDLALVTVRGSDNYLQIFSFTEKGAHSVQEIKLPRQIGPTLYFDSREKGVNDLVYVSIEHGVSYLNVHRALNAPTTEDVAKGKEYFSRVNNTKVFNSEPDLKINLTEKLGGAVVTLDENGMPTGTFLADFQARGRKDILLTVSTKDSTIIKAIQLGETDISFPDYNEVFAKYKKVISVSAADIRDQGKEDIVINHVVDGQVILTAVGAKSPVENSKASFLTMKNVNGSFKHIPGVTYLVFYDGGRKFTKISQTTHSSYSSLMHPGVYTGLGITNFFINYVLVHTNMENGELVQKQVDGVVIPNTFVIFHIKDGKWLVQIFPPFKHFPRVAIGLGIILFINFAALLYIASKEHKDVSYTRNVESMKPIFAAL